ncbi:MAG: Tfp pilus assembly protein FimT/FimU [Syntrophales bacterium]
MRTLKAGICNRGLTLLELLVVIFIVSLALAISFPSFTIQTDGNLKSEAGHIASILRYLNDSAISTKETYAVNLNFDEKVIRYNGTDGEKTEKIDNLSRITLQSRGNVSEGDVTVLFGPAGAAETFTIHLTGVESSMDIIFNALSGRVKVTAHEQI